VEGPGKFGNVIYYGTAPEEGLEQLADVLTSSRNVADLQLAFDPKTGRLFSLEMVADSAEDGCRILFSDYRDAGGREFPHAMEIRRGEETFAEIRWSDVTLAISPSAKAAEENKP
jgi:hypothetical protein